MFIRIEFESKQACKYVSFHLFDLTVGVVVSVLLNSSLSAGSSKAKNILQHLLYIVKECCA